MSNNYYGGKAVSLERDELITPKRSVNTNDDVYDANGNTIKITSKLYQEKDFAVYTCNKNNKLVKLFHSTAEWTMTNNLQSKIEYMVANPIKDKNVAWAIDAIYDDTEKFLGYTMTNTLGVSLHDMIFNDGDNSRIADMPKMSIKKFSRQEVVEMILSILSTVENLHKEKVLVGNISLKNFEIVGKDTANIRYVNCDQCQIDVYPSVLSEEQFTAPELDGKGLDRVYRTYGNENYGLFALLFALLHGGVSPYEQKGEVMNAKEARRAEQGLFPYSNDSIKTTEQVENRCALINWSHLPKYIKNAFIQNCSMTGDNFGEGRRYDTSEWHKIMSIYHRDLISGRLKSLDPDSDIGLHDENEPQMDYNVLAIDIETIAKETYADLTLNKAVRKLFDITGQKVDEATIGLAVSTLHKTTKYENKQYTLTLVKNVGVLSEVEITYKS